MVGANIAAISLMRSGRRHAEARRRRRDAGIGYIAPDKPTAAAEKWGWFGEAVAMAREDRAVAREEGRKPPSLLRGIYRHVLSNDTDASTVGILASMGTGFLAAFGTITGVAVSGVVPLAGMPVAAAAATVVLGTVGVVGASFLAAPFIAGAIALAGHAVVNMTRSARSARSARVDARLEETAPKAQVAPAAVESGKPGISSLPRLSESFSRAVSPEAKAAPGQSAKPAVSAKFTI